MLLSSAVKIIPSGYKIGNTQKGVPDTNLEPKIVLLAPYIYIRKAVVSIKESVQHCDRLPDLPLMKST